MPKGYPPPKNKWDLGYSPEPYRPEDGLWGGCQRVLPVYESMTVEGDKVRISFSSVGGGLITKDKYGYVRGFADRRCG